MYHKPDPSASYQPDKSQKPRVLVRRKDNTEEEIPAEFVQYDPETEGVAFEPGHEVTIGAGDSLVYQWAVLPPSEPHNAVVDLDWPLVKPTVLSGSISISEHDQAADSDEP